MVARKKGSYNITRKVAWTVLVTGLMITATAVLYLYPPCFGKRLSSRSC
ncbi:MAG: hypothetical protein NT118_05825 [Lentisphaerae bacterium]|nr:hypothetical protein [Lentisphaerota bacterium]